MSRRVVWVLAAFALLPMVLPSVGQEAPAQPFLWAYGADNLGSLPYAKGLGLNTVMLELKAPLTSEELTRAKVTVKEAGEYGLQVIVGMPLTLSEQYSTSLGNSRYVKGVSDYVRQTVPALIDEPNVIGWATGDYLERDLKLADGEFQAYVLHKYGSMDALGDVWGLKVSSQAELTIENTPKLDDELPFAAGLPSVDLADFQALKYREMMQFWADLVRDVTGGKGLLFTGRVTLYRSLPSVPDAYDVIVVSMPPELLERDRATHNVQAIDIARRGGRRRVIPCLRLFVPGEDEKLSLGQAVSEWAMEAALHGADGLSFEAPPETLADLLVQKQWKEALAWMVDQPAWRSRPRGTAAILYEPYAEGFSSLEVPIYGYIKGLSSREPSDLINSLKQGTRYGLMDYLTLADVTRGDLDRYGVIFAPMALSLPDDAQQRLEEYVKGGGVFVADIGVGFEQSGSWQVLPPRLAQLFGIPGFHDMKGLAGNLTIHQPHPALPSLPSGASTTGDFVSGTPGRKVGSGAYAVSGWAGSALIPDGTVPFARLAMSATEDKKPLFAGVVARNTGAGTAFLATHRLWSSWLPQHRLFEPFHSDLWERRARIELLDARFIAPAMEISENEEGSVFLYNRGQAQRIQVALFAAQHRLFAGAVCQFTSRLVEPTGLRTGAVLATLDMPPHTSVEVTATPIEVRPYGDAVTACLTRYEPEGTELAIAGEGSGPSGRPGQLSISHGTEEGVRIIVKSGAYPITPASKHKVCVTETGGETREDVLTADDEGRLRIEATVATARITIAPA
jgi:hypothetical protein